MTGTIPCDAWQCKKAAVFKTKRPGRHGENKWCAIHFAAKTAKYELTVERVRN